MQGTHARAPYFPFTFGKHSRRNQVKIEEKGTLADYWAKSIFQTSSGERIPIYAGCIRGGSKAGKATLMFSSSASIKPDSYTYKYNGRDPAVPFHEDPIICKRVERFMSGLLRLTLGDGGREWFCLRRRIFTSSVAAYVIGH